MYGFIDITVILQYKMPRNPGCNGNITVKAQFFQQDHCFWGVKDSPCLNDGSMLTLRKLANDDAYIVLFVILILMLHNLWNNWNDKCAY